MSNILIQYGNGTIETVAAEQSMCGFMKFLGLQRGGITAVLPLFGLNLNPNGLRFDYHQSNN